ncbi:RNA polymerase sigma-70 factor, ECF subfamily [Desulfuromusa kysingii]|uniref:RNA polymerase sigma-70 factor, ECF subfamily n=1 Tax=Desulfuromusa kysingii TaxID=37625 RepID=A0A1H4BYJ2_9BACT|nr:RNA polymerase sigma factor [Desulfuromusa kysingii]SEA53159.1 RNA polymerase sigma-70 factor, ECF subfamily [Desulfuromusa kysingii]
MEFFFKSIERQAYRMALFACSNQDDALDLVQDSMCKFVAKYRDKPEEEWKVLFYKILQNKIRDFYRKQSVRSRWRMWLKRDFEDADAEPLEQFPDPVNRTPEHETANQQMFTYLQQELKKLSLKQQQVFLLRAWEGLSVGETALAMKCSEGTIKTHYFRATEKLKKKLGEHWL